MKTLYISDLDGTLLGSDASLSDSAVERLNSLMLRGVNFSVATARTAATADKLLERMNINMPIVLMNGVLVYDKSKKLYIKKELLPRHATERVISAMHSTDVPGMMYGLKGGKLCTYYEKISNESMREFIDERREKFGKKFVNTSDVSLHTDECEVIYFCFIDEREKIAALKEAIGEVEGLRIESYKDIYSDGDIWYLEAFSANASKSNAVMYLKKEYGFEKVVAFGDNLNDLPMFEIADEAYAVANAKDELKSIATAVIGPNTSDGVVEWLEKNA